MAAVHPDYQSQGLGLRLKHTQKNIALQQGYEVIAWTFDPLQARNAYFNFALLGTTARNYHINFYGTMSDEINGGLPSDRLEVEWHINNTNQLTSSYPAADTGSVALSVDPITIKPLANLSAIENAAPVRVEIPADIHRLRLQSAAKALEWRMALRDCIVTYLKAGYTISGFQKDLERGFYLLCPPAPWFLYIVKCADGSLYTGISTDVRRRIQQHNAGSGAKYTATRNPVVFQGMWKYSDRSSASRAENALKRLNREEKLALIQNLGSFRKAEFISRL
jgi:predicted GIY-YIG superfamily endonuclease